MALEKHHTGDFVPGGTGTYVLTVSNVLGSEDVPVNQAICVTDCIPEGLSYQDASGTGWSCQQGVLCTGILLTCNPSQAVSCENTAGLPMGESLPPITLLVNLPSGLPALIVNYAEVYTDGDLNQADDPDSDVLTSVPVPVASAAGLGLMVAALAYLGGRRLLRSRRRR